jgi:hypothetical protein
MIVEIPEYIMRNLTHDKELPRLVGMEWIAEPPEEKP